MYKLLIFDWDGTLMDSAARIVSSMQAAARDLSLAVPSDQAVRDIIGLGLPEAIDILIPGISAADNEAMRQRYGHFFLGADDTPLAFYPDAFDGLFRLKAAGFQLAVATGKSRRGIDRVFSDYQLGEVFCASRGADETLSKPDPLMLHEILEQTGVALEQAIMIGDTEYDLAMAQRANMHSLGVSYGMHSVARLEQFSPQVIVDDFKAMETWLMERKHP